MPEFMSQSQILCYQTQIAEDVPVYAVKLPKEILKELDQWVFEAKKVKNHPLSNIKSHENIGYDPTKSSEENGNSYQCSLNTQLVENSFWLAYTLRLCAGIFGGYHRFYKMRKWDGHFDGYDIWANFAYLGDNNPVHRHAGDVSGVIYYKNHNHPTIFPDYNVQYCGENGTMVLFPSDVQHLVEPQKTNKERITIAFNIDNQSIHQ